MAKIKAIQNGNWSDGTTWSSSTVPTLADDVYLNGKTVTIGANDCNAKLISNFVDDEIGAIEGGYINVSMETDYTIQSDFKSATSKVIYLASTVHGKTITIIGDIEATPSIYAIEQTQHNRTINIIGNVTNNLLQTNSAVYYVYHIHTLSINGNVSLTGSNTLWSSPNSGNFNYNNWNLIVNGNVNLYGNSMLLNTFTGNGHYSITVVVNGNSSFYDDSNIGKIRLFPDAYGRFCSVTFNGNLYANNFIYLVNNCTVNQLVKYNLYIQGVCEIVNSLSQIVLSNTSVYGDVKYYDKSKCLGLFISQNIDLSNLQSIEYVGAGNPLFYAYPYDYVNDTYPAESDVKLNVEYGMQNEKKGTYSPTILTDEQLQRIANCATMDEVAELAVSVANKES